MEREKEQYRLNLWAFISKKEVPKVHAMQYKVEDLARFFVCALLVVVVVVAMVANVSLSPQSTVGNRGRGSCSELHKRLVCTGLHQPLQDVFYVYPKSHFLNTVVCWQHC